jgi:hypothetical protein
MRDTSQEAFAAILEGLSDRRGKVFAAFFQADGELCDYEAAAVLGWPINCVTGRRQELETMGYLVDVGRRTGPTGNEMHYFRVNPAALAAGFEPRALAKKTQRERRAPEMSVREAARVLAAARRGTKQRPVARKPLPLFGI